MALEIGPIVSRFHAITLLETESLYINEWVDGT